MKRLVFLTIIFLSTHSFSQNRNNMWYFGEYAAMDFNTSPPTPLGSSMMTQLEGCASISNNNGQLLFYTDGISVWNRNNQVMPNGTGLLGGFSSSQSALIIPIPSNNNLYYLFTVPTQSATVPFSYSIVDMTLNGGLGDISTTKNVAIHTPVMEKLTGTLKSNGTEYWVVVKEFGTDAFLAYSLTAAGLDLNPVISHTGHTSTILQDIGYGRISHNGARLCIAYEISMLYQLFDFNNVTGIVSNPIDLHVAPPLGNVPYGLEFSPDNNKLYTLGEGNFSELVQYDLLAGSQAAIQNSAVIIANEGMNQVGGALALGPDNKIYVNYFHRPFLSVINQPNLAGAACGYVFATVPLAPTFNLTGLGLPNFIRYANDIPCAPTQNFSNSVMICSNQTYQLPSGTIVNTAGIYNDTIRGVNSCDSIITTVDLSVFPVTHFNIAVEICSNQTYQLPSGTIVSNADIYQDTIRSVSLCDSIITTVDLSVFPVTHFNISAEICSGQTYQLPSGTIVNTTGIYQDTIRSVSSCDSIITTIDLSVFPVTHFNIAVQICFNQTYQLPSGTIINAAGVYQDTIRSTSSCDSIITTVNLSVSPVNYFNTSIQICSNETYHLPSGTIVNTAGIYQDTIRSVNSCDSIVTTVQLFVHNVSSSGIIDSVYAGESYLLPSGQTVNGPGTYQSVLINSVGCDSVVTITLKEKKKLFECITLNNAFTPNGDGINDYWILYKYNCFKKLEVNVYNRYGSQVYYSNNYKNDWNGTYKNKPVPDGTYYYVIKVISFDGKEYTFRNNVTILR